MGLFKEIARHVPRKSSVEYVEKSLVRKTVLFSGDTKITAQEIPHNWGKTPGVEITTYAGEQIIGKQTLKPGEKTLLTKDTKYDIHSTKEVI
jgi:hypothetical protein